MHVHWRQQLDMLCSMSQLLFVLQCQVLEMCLSPFANVLQASLLWASYKWLSVHSHTDAGEVFALLEHAVSVSVCFSVFHLYLCYCWNFTLHVTIKTIANHVHLISTPCHSPVMLLKRVNMQPVVPDLRCYMAKKQLYYFLRKAF